MIGKYESWDIAAAWALVDLASHKDVRVWLMLPDSGIGVPNEVCPSADVVVKGDYALKVWSTNYVKPEFVPPLSMNLSIL